jgi:ribosome biogenesis protein SLX9
LLVGTVTGLEASRAPYSKSHARRLKRREKEQLTGHLGSLKAALPSIAPITAATVGERSAEVDAATTTTVITTATADGNFGVSVKPITKSNKPFTSDQLEAPPAPPPTRPGQIGEGNGVTLTRSQRRRALYGLIQLSSCVCD